MGMFTRGASAVQSDAWNNATLPQLRWRDAVATHIQLREDDGRAQMNPNKGTGGYPSLAILNIVGGNYQLHPTINNGLGRSYVLYAVPETASKLYLGVSPQEMFVGDVFSAQLMFYPKIVLPTVNQGSESGKIARGALSI